MDTSRLNVGMVVKNYKELCELLGEPIKAGDSRKYQLIDWDRYFKYSKQGHKFIIEEIYEVTLEKSVKRGGNNLLPFIDELEILLIDTIVKSKQDTYIATKSKIMLDLFMVNPNYHKYFVKRDVLSNLLGMDVQYVVDFYDTTTSTFKSAIQTVTKRLENKKLIIHEQVYMVNYIEQEEIIDRDDQGNIVKGKKPVNVYREATKEEREKILEIERSILKYKYECNDIQCLYKKNKVHSYYHDVEQELSKQLGFISAHKAERYTYNVEELIDQKFYLLKKYQIEDMSNTINNKVMFRINDNSTKRYEKAIRDLVEYGKMNYSKQQRYYDDYVDNENIISSVVIDKDNADISELEIDSKFLDDTME